jgi:hypothetical protein
MPAGPLTLMVEHSVRFMVIDVRIRLASINSVREDGLRTV